MPRLLRLSIPIGPRRSLLLGLLMFFVLSAPSEAGWVTQKPFAEEEGLVWYTDGRALYRYNPESDDWSPISIDGFQEGTIHALGTDYGLLWLATDQGVYRFDIRVESWTHYGKEVLGIDRVSALDFGEDFVWVTGEDVLARFDIYVETWETLDILRERSIGAVRDIVVEDRYVWLAAEAGIVRYDQQFGQVRTFSGRDGALSGEIREAFRFGGDVWFWGDQGLCRYEAGLETWEVYGAEEGLPAGRVQKIALGGQELWLISPDAVFRFDGRPGKWAPFVEVKRLMGRSLHDIAPGGEVVWFGTEDGLYGYDVRSGEWDILRKVDGLSSDEVLEVFLLGDLLLCVHREGIDVYDGEEWRATSFARMKRSHRKRRIGVALEKGGLSARDSKGNAARLGGRYRFAAEWRGTRTPEEDWPPPSMNSRGKAASILSGELAGGRTLGGYYDNTDPDDLRFGGTYRGADGDPLQRLSGGEIRAEAVRYGTSSFRGLGGSESLVGGEAQMRWGKTQPWGLHLWGGRPRSRFAQEFFLGADGPMFRLEHRRIVPRTLQIRIDGEIIDTRLYTVSPSLGVFFFHRERFVAPDSEIEAFYEYEDDDLTEEVFRSQVGWEVSERFSLGANLVHRGFDDLDVGEIHGQVRWRSVARDVEIRLIPELAFSRASGRAAQLHLIGTWSDLQLDGVWREFGEGFRTVGQRALAFGVPRRIVDLSSRYHIRQHLPIDLAWRREEAEEGREDRWSAGMLLSKALWPQLALKFARGEARSSQTERSLDQWTFRSRWDLARIPLLTGRLDRLLFQGQYQYMHRATEGPSPVASSTSRSAWMSLDLIPEDRVSSKTDLWWSCSEDREENHRWIAQFHAYEFVPGILAFAQFDGERSARFNGDLQDVSFDGMLNLTGAVSPGTWFDALRWVTLYPRCTWSRRMALEDAPRRWDLRRTLRETWSTPLSATSLQELRTTLDLGSDWSLTEILSRERQEKGALQTDRKDVAVSRLDIHRGADRFLLRHEFIRAEADAQSTHQHDASIRWGRRWSEAHRTDGEFRYREERDYSKRHALISSIELFTRLEPRRFFDDIYLRPALSFERNRSDQTTDYAWTGRLRLDLDFLKALTQRLDVEAACRESQFHYTILAQLRAEF